MRRFRDREANPSNQQAEWSCDDEIDGGQQQQQQQQQEGENNNNEKNNNDTLCDLYNKVKVLKRGSQGVIYLAREKNQQEQQLVAIKRMFSDLREERMRGLPEAILREIGILSRLSSSNSSSSSSSISNSSSVVTALSGSSNSNQNNNNNNNSSAIGSDNVIRFVGMTTTRSAGELCLVMEACEGGDISSFVQATGQPSLGFISHVLQGLLRSLVYVHSLNILHRDVKQSNLLMRKDGTPVLGDFGSARQIFSSSSSNPNSNSTTQEQQVVPPLTPGSHRTTLPYRAPELLLGARNYSGAIDIWGAGVIFAELLRGNHLFVQNSEMQTLSRVFQFIGTPTDQTWPEFKQFPLLQAFNFQAQDAQLRSDVARWCPPQRCSNQQQGQLEQGQKEEEEERSLEIVVDLLEKMLSGNPAARPTARECLNHPFFSAFPADCSSWLRWREEGNVSKPSVPMGGALSLAGLGEDDDDDDEDEAEDYPAFN